MRTHIQVTEVFSRPQMRVECRDYSPHHDFIIVTLSANSECTICILYTVYIMYIIVNCITNRCVFELIYLLYCSVLADS